MNFIPARENEEMSLKNEILRCIRYNRAVERKAMTDHCHKVPIKPRTSCFSPAGSRYYAP